MKELRVPAKIEELYRVQEFVEEELVRYRCTRKTVVQIAIAVEEIYVNIAKYAYHPDVGEATIRCQVGGNPLLVIIQFMDNGNPFNPLSKPYPDTTCSAEERGIGGLGILMVKESMDEVDYSYEGGANVLTIKKELI